MTVYRQNGPFLLPPAQPHMREAKIVGPIESAISVWTEDERRPARAFGDWSDVWRRFEGGRQP